MAENEHTEPRIHITPDAQMIGKLDTLREVGETYPDLIKRLVDDRITERRSHGDAVSHVKLVPELRKAIDAIRQKGETRSAVIMRVVEAYQYAEDVRVDELTPGRSYTVFITKSMRSSLDTIREGDESYVSTIRRLIEEHQVAEAQQSMTPVGATRAMRVKPSTYSRIESMVQGDESYDEVVTRLLDERSMYRLIAKNKAAEGRRLLHNHNFKLVINEITAIDTIVDQEDNCGVQQDVDELMKNTLSTPLDEGDSK
ncbi:MAG: hypothetical protein J7K40_03960 [candidate division Zixibacteria bacterium]|nr:hypothetical protein [candidate division Zixibacteria bacterium]